MAFMDRFKKEAAEQLPGARIGKEAIKKANEVFREYKEGKVNLERRLIENEKWFRLRHWEVMDAAGRPSGNPMDARPTSAWLFNILMGKQADAIEAYPEPRILPRMMDDKQTAAMLSDITPLVLEQNGFEQVYSNGAWKKNKHGSVVYGVFWDKSKLNGLGDIAIRETDVLNLFWQPGVEDIQDSRNLFHAELVDNEVLEEAYPELQGKLKGQGSITLNTYAYDDHINTDKKSLVVDWYYKRVVEGRTVLHYCKYVGEHVLFATENDEKMSQTGWYDDGLYPFVVDVLFPVEGSPCGIGYVDIAKSPQESIDLLGQQLVKNATMAATPRYFKRKDGGVNEAEFMDWTRPLVDVEGTIDPSVLMPIQVTPLSGAYLAVYQEKVNELKNTSANTDVMNGGTGGMTTASGVAAMQESAGRSSRASTLGTYRAYARLITMVIERMRQFYDIPRTFRILGKQGAMQFVQFSNQGLLPQNQGNAFGIELGYRLPVFDVEVKAAKQTPFSRQAQNELAIQMFTMGAFNPQMADQITMLLDMMDFPGKEELAVKVAQNGQLFKQLQAAIQAAMSLAQRYEPQNLPQLAQMLGLAPPGGMEGPKPGRPLPKGQLPTLDNVNPDRPQEKGIVKNARIRAAEVNLPR